MKQLSPKQINLTGEKVQSQMALSPKITPQNSVNGLRFNLNTNKVDVNDHFSLLHSNLSQADAADILEMANIAISRSQQKQRKQ